MEQNDKIKELFSEKLGNFESSVRPELWSNIASQIGTTGTLTTVSSGVSVVTKTIIGISVAAAVGAFAYIALINASQEPMEKVVGTTTENVIEKEKTTLKPSNVSTNKSKGNTVDYSDVENQSIDPLVGENIVPTTNDFVGFILESEDLQTTQVQQADLKGIEILQEQQQENRIIKELFSSENSSKSSNSEAIYESESVVVELPNVFSPNNDGANDYLEIKSTGLNDFNIVVLDVNGKTVFQSTDPSFKWDGMNLSNEKVKDGNYLYYITARDAEGQLISKSQTLRITTQH
ncbi:MAG: gliding motility-associated C-terminal domain-containing protein [Crocinitomicaceae bacterium]|nr:gliding motility-associated C-terminal domain-containing protein [Crocinitomicaceae bacterium]